MQCPSILAHWVSYISIFLVTPYLLTILNDIRKNQPVCLKGMAAVVLHHFFELHIFELLAHSIAASSQCKFFKFTLQSNLECHGVWDLIILLLSTAKIIWPPNGKRCFCLSEKALLKRWRCMTLLTSRMSRLWPKCCDPWNNLNTWV